jgi:4'-phosphopantetheinyl transferase
LPQAQGRVVELSNITQQIFFFADCCKPSAVKMSFAFGRGALKHCFVKQNLVDWFMNRNVFIARHIVWHRLSDPGLIVASFTDDATLDISDLRDVLSPSEKNHAVKLTDPVELRHYIARRCFQRLFVAEVLSTNITPSKLDIIHQTDVRPFCPSAPDLNLSFSSSGTTAIACASKSHAVGIDIERSRKVVNVIALARRYFTPEEAETLANLPDAEQSLAFLHYWTAKEAGLKALGKGIIFGLNTFTIKDKGKFSFEFQGPNHNLQDWSLQYLQNVPQHLVALVKKNDVGKV